MTRPPGRPALGMPGAGQLGLDVEAAPAGVVEAACELALGAAVEDGLLGATDLALMALVLKVAGAVDRADARADVRAVVSAARELQSLLVSLGLAVPARRAPAGDAGKDGERDDLAAFLATLGDATLGDAADA